MNLTVETIAALRAQGVPAEAVLDAIQAALKARIEHDREQARLRQQRSRANRRPRRASSEACHSDKCDPSPDKKKNPPDPLKEKTNPIQAKPSASSADEAEQGTLLPADWTPIHDHLNFAVVQCRRAMSQQVKDAGRGEIGFDEHIEEFAYKFMNQEAKRFRGWAITWKRRHPDWHGRFTEWLRIEFSKLERGKTLPTITRSFKFDGETGSENHNLHDAAWWFLLGANVPEGVEEVP